MGQNKMLQYFALCKTSLKILKIPEQLTCSIIVEAGKYFDNSKREKLITEIVLLTGFCLQQLKKYVGENCVKDKHNVNTYFEFTGFFFR